MRRSGGLRTNRSHVAVTDAFPSKFLVELAIELRAARFERFGDRGEGSMTPRFLLRQSSV
ncbi:MAG: hypothetical protein DLM70_02915 [Chloroflexi bacterium]|nr:MAG: hypothetical protein DLM70_02915 [Chloroflexota bacterium]